MIKLIEKIICFVFYAFVGSVLTSLLFSLMGFWIACVFFVICRTTEWLSEELVVDVGRNFILVWFTIGAIIGSIFGPWRLPECPRNCLP